MHRLFINKKGEQNYYSKIFAHVNTIYFFCHK